MSGLAELHRLLAAVQGGIADARAHTERAKVLLEESRRAIVDAQAQAQPWVPDQLAQAVELLAAQGIRLNAAGDLLNGYQARL
jgi:hypothetical protein